MEGNLKLLFVSEDADVGKKVQQIFKNLFDEILIAENGNVGYAYYQKHTPQVILSDIALPLMNGLELTSKIRILNPVARIILLSESGEPEIFIKAFEKGVKGVVLKPLNYGQLLVLITEQVQEIALVKRAKEEEFKRLRAEKEYDKSKRILHAVSQATALFFRAGFSEQTVNKVIKLIGDVSDASRVYIYKIFSEDQKEYTSRIYEWTAREIMPVIGNLSVTGVEIATSGFNRWVDIMRENKGHVAGFVKDFELSEQVKLREHGIVSVIAIPIFVNKDWWGFIGLDDCLKERVWTEPEISALEALANNLGAAIHKRELDNQMVELNKSLERRVKDRTKELEFEVAERAMAEALLKDSEEKYRLIYENAMNGILLIQKGRISLVNPAMVDMLEELPRNLIGRKFADLVVKENRKEVKMKFKKDAGQFSTGVFNVQIITGQGIVKWLELNPTRITWYGDPAYLVFVSNITLRKKAEDELQLLNATLEKRVEEEIKRVELQQQLLIQKSKLESLGEVSAGLAHEINQPLVSISMGLDNLLMMISDGVDDHEYQKNKIQVLFNDIDRIKKTIDHIRIFSRDQQNTEIDIVNISQVIRDAISMVNRQLNEQNIKLEIGCLEEDVYTLGNHYKIEQVVLNLISNARFAVNEKEKREMVNDYTKIISISCRRTDSNAYIEIYDNGIGIPEEIITDIFDPFFTTKSEDKGTGLGLSISYGIVKELHGEIFAKSNENKFTQIIVELPLHIN